MDLAREAVYDITPLTIIIELGYTSVDISLLLVDIGSSIMA